MRKSKAIQLLRSLKPSEFDRLKLYAQSPYCNPNKNALLVLKEVQKFYPDFNNNALEKKRFFKKVYPQKKYNEAYLRKQLSGLYQMTKAFLATEEWNGREDLQQQFLLNQLQERDLEAIFQIHFDQFSKDLHAGMQKDEAHYYQAFQMAKVADQYYEQKEPEEQKDTLQAKADNLDVFYLMQKLSVTCEMLLHTQDHGGKFQLPLVKELVSFLEQNQQNYQQIGGIIVYQQLLKMLVYQNDTQHYFSLTDLLETHHISFSKQEQAKLLNYCEKYCLRKIRQGDQDFLHHLFELYQLQLELEVQDPHPFFHEDTYQKMSTLALGLRQYDWTEKFIYTYREKLDPNIEHDLFHLQKAQLYYHKGQLDDACQLLQNVQFSDLSFQIKAQYLLFKSLFDDDQPEALLDKVEDFNLQLMRMNTLSTQEKQGIKNYLVLLKRIVQLHSQSHQWSEEEYLDRKAKVEERLDQVDPIVQGPWLKTIFAQLS